MSKKLSIIQINDVHGYIEPHLEHFYDSKGLTVKEAGGFSRMKTVIENSQKERTTFIFDNGDTFHGTYEAVKSKGEQLIPLVNELGIQAMTFHWDIGYGPERLKAIGEKLNYPILAINAYKKETEELYFEPYTIVNQEDISIGIIGIAATIIDKTMPSHFSEGLYFTLGNKELPKYVKELQEKEVDLIVVLSHLGFPQDVKMMEEVKGIDICLSGHTHNRLSKPVQINDTIIIQSGSQSSFIGKIDLTVDDRQIVELQHSLMTITEDIFENPKMKGLVNKAVEPYKEQLTKIVGYTDGILHRGWNVESTMDNLLLEAIQYQTNSDLVFSNGWRYGALIDKGPITLKQLYQIIPMNPPISTTELAGEEIYEMLEENIENTYSTNPYNQMGGYLKRALGLKVFFKVENPKGHRIQTLLIKGEPVDLDKIYSVSYVTNQGVPNKYGKNHKNLEVHAIEAMRGFLKEKEVYHAKFFGTFELI